jgi:hypothetical protein
LFDERELAVPGRRRFATLIVSRLDMQTHGHIDGEIHWLIRHDYLPVIVRSNRCRHCCPLAPLYSRLLSLFFRLRFGELGQ